MLKAIGALFRAANLNLTWRCGSAGLVPEVTLVREEPGASRTFSELVEAVLRPPISTRLVRLEEEDAGLPRLSGASWGSKFRLGASE